MLCWSHIPHCWKSHAVAQIFLHLWILPSDGLVHYIILCVTGKISNKIVFHTLTISFVIVNIVYPDEGDISSGSPFLGICPFSGFQISKSYSCTNLHNWAMTFDFQQCGILTSADSDKPVQTPFILKTPNDVQSVAYFSDQQRLWSDCAYAQADLRLCLSNIPHCWKSHVTAH